MAWVKWNLVIAPLARGGLGVGGLRVQNLSLIGKWWWRFHVCEEAFWVKVIKSIYGPGGGLEPSGFRIGNRGPVWGGVIKTGQELENIGLGWANSFKIKVGDGSRVSFWNDRWAGENKLVELCPRLYQLECNKNASVRDRVRESNGRREWIWDWNREPRGRALGELETLLIKTRDFSFLTGVKDSWSWSLARDGSFSVKTLRCKIEEKVSEVPELSRPKTDTWNPLIPKKVCIFAWRAKMDRLPTRVVLDRRGIDLHTVLCPWCNEVPETLDHCLINCHEIYPIWEEIFKWWGWDIFGPHSVAEILAHTGSVNSNLSTKLLWQALIWSAAFLIWKNRNSCVFKQKATKNDLLCSEIKTIAFNWISSRFKKGEISWDGWLSSPTVAAQSCLHSRGTGEPTNIAG